MSKGERITRFVEELAGGAHSDGSEVSQSPFYRGYFQCWNAQQYYEAHDVLEHLWLRTTSADANFFKGLIQGAGAFVHLQKQFQHPTHAKHGRRLAPARRLLRLAARNLAPFEPVRHAFDVAAFQILLARYAQTLSDSELRINPWSPDDAPTLSLLH